MGYEGQLRKEGRKDGRSEIFIRHQMFMGKLIKICNFEIQTNGNLLMKILETFFVPVIMLPIELQLLRNHLN